MELIKDCFQIIWCIKSNVFTMHMERVIVHIIMNTYLSSRDQIMQSVLFLISLVRLISLMELDVMRKSGGENVNWRE